MTRPIAEMVFALLFLASPPTQKLSESQLHDVLWCIQQKGSEVGAPLRHFDNDNIRFRYQAGPYTFRNFDGQAITVGKDGQVEFGVYGPHGHSLVIYDIYLTEKDERTVVDLGYPSSFSRHGHSWIAGDNPGGMATRFYMDQLVKSFSSQEPQTMPLVGPSTPSQNVSCVR